MITGSCRTAKRAIRRIAPGPEHLSGLPACASDNTTIRICQEKNFESDTRPAYSGRETASIHRMAASSSAGSRRATCSAMRRRTSADLPSGRTKRNSQKLSPRPARCHASTKRRVAPFSSIRLSWDLTVFIPFHMVAARIRHRGRLSVYPAIVPLRTRRGRRRRGPCAARQTRSRRRRRHCIPPISKTHRCSCR